MLRRAVESARAVVVHNPGAAAMVRENGGRNVHVIPHFFESAAVPDGADRERFRQRIGVTPGTTIFGIFGYLRETKRLLACIGAFRRLNAVRPATALLIAGDVVSGDLNRLLADEALHPAIHRLGHLSDADFRTAAAAVDCCLNLRYPAAGETSGIAIRLMGMGKPVILTEGPETAAIPPDACLRVPAGVDESSVLFDQMALVAEFPGVARRIGAEGAEHIRSCHGLERAVRQYWQVIESVMD
jgi:glycosyltransferase involved in cell wall biosynthesis